MTTVDIDPVRARILNAFLPIIARKAQDAIRAGRKPDDFIMVCVDINDEIWGEVFGDIVKERGAERHDGGNGADIVICAMPHRFAELLARGKPHFADALLRPVSGDEVARLVVLADGGITVLRLRPDIPQSDLN